jgi:hypothetical protein
MQENRPETPSGDETSCVSVEPSRSSPATSTSDAPTSMMDEPRELAAFARVLRLRNIDNGDEVPWEEETEGTGWRRSPSWRSDGEQSDRDYTACSANDCGYCGRCGY